MTDSSMLYPAEMLDGEMPELELPAPPFAAATLPRVQQNVAVAEVDEVHTHRTPTSVETAPEIDAPSPIALPTFNDELVMSQVSTERRKQDRRNTPRATPDRRIGAGSFASPWMIQQHERLPVLQDAMPDAAHAAPLTPRIPDSLPPRELVNAALHNEIATTPQASHMPPAAMAPPAMTWPTADQVPTTHTPASNIPATSAFPDLAPAAESMNAIDATSMLPPAAHAAAISPDAWFGSVAESLPTVAMHPPVETAADVVHHPVAEPSRRRPHIIERLMFMVVVPAAAGIGIGYLVLAMVR